MAKQIAKKKILIYGMSNNAGGVEAFIKNAYTNLDAQRYELHFCCFEKPGANYDCLVEKGHKVHTVIKGRHNYFAYRRFWNCFFKTNKFDAVINNACDIVSNDLLKFAKKHGVATRILHSHNSGNQVVMNPLHKLEERINKLTLGKYVTHYWACSQIAGEWMFGSRPFTVIKNGIDTSAYMYSPKTRDEYVQLFDSNKRIGFVGRLSAQKNPLLAVDAFCEYNKKFPDAKLYFVGEGEIKQQIIHKANALGVGDKVVLLGRRNDVNKLMSFFDCLIMTSDFEGLPFVLVEAQASGLPCVVIDNVSAESKLSDLVTFVKNDAPLSLWADEIKNALSTNPQREKYCNIVKDKGFDIKTTVRQIDDILGGNI